MLTDVLPHLRCPVADCHRPLTSAAPVEVALRCAQDHSFDLARQGYVSLTTGRVTHPGDTPAMVAARESFLRSGAFTFLGEALADAAREVAAPALSPLVLDTGAGTGHYLAAVLDAVPHATGLALDLSKPALRRAARCHPRAGAVRADTWHRLPVADAAATVLLNVFAPRHGAEFARVLAPGGELIVVTPTADHLAELVDRLAPASGVRMLSVDPEKPGRVAADLERWFTPVAAQTHVRRLTLDRGQARDLVAMSPSGAHTAAEALDRAVADLPESVPVTASVRLARYTPARHAPPAPAR